MSDPLDELTPVSLLSSIASRLRMDEDDALALEAQFTRLRVWLLSVLENDVLDVQLYGSLTRRTRLSAPYDPAPDIDCLLVLDSDVFFNRYVLSRDAEERQRPELLWAQDIYDRLRSSKEFDEHSFTYNPPFLSLRVGLNIFELTMSTRVQSESVGGLYTIFGTRTREEMRLRSLFDEEAENQVDPEVEDEADDGEADDDEADDDGETEIDKSPNEFDYIERDAEGNIIWTYENTISTEEPISPDGELFSLAIMADPFAYNQFIDQYQEMYGDFWLYLILLWKFWRKSSSSPIESYVIEDNVFRGLQSAQPFIEASDDGDINLLHFVATYFRNTKLYDFRRFERDQSFCTFRDQLILADDLSRSGCRIEGLDVLALLFLPWGRFS